MFFLLFMYSTVEMGLQQVKFLFFCVVYAFLYLFYTLFGGCRCLKSPNELTFILTLLKNLINNFLRFITLYALLWIIIQYSTFYVK